MLPSKPSAASSRSPTTGNSVVLISDGSYGIEKGIIWLIADPFRRLESRDRARSAINDFVRGKIDASIEALADGRAIVWDLVPA
jgi:hypothetical protein